ncbi:uncharacterized protein EAE97_007325 [Botrytis byssoidea]|uniref:Uncharacterized protein n=1 Tax=Botrytis byssoidea TaxID=139641 RepID=A0A9P5ILL4_9HELO|nr:uncharacterized protein EAE97_007325 [Botrytis byssoidea]KAF7939245.1 hypothetical protein EAE97_007325 [Botrytis byssoidea]
MDYTEKISSGNKRLSLRRSIVGSIKRSLSPLSRKSESPTTSQTSGCSVQSTHNSLSSLKGQSLPASVSSKSSRFKKSTSLSPNSHVVTKSTEILSSPQGQLPPNSSSSEVNKVPTSRPFSFSNRISVQSMQEIFSSKKEIPTRAASTTSKLTRSLSITFFNDKKHSVQSLKDVPSQENNQFLPTQTSSSAESRLPRKFHSSSTTPNIRSSIQSIRELQVQEKDVSLPTRASSTSSRYSAGVRVPPIMNQTKLNSEQPFPPPSAKRTSVVSFQIPEGVQVSPLQNDMLLTLQPPSNSSKSNRSSWLSLSRHSSTRSKKTSQPTRLQRLALVSSRGTSRSQQNYISTSAKETTLPWDPPFDRNWDLCGNDGVPMDSNETFEYCLPPRQNDNFSPFFDMPTNIRRKIYSYCLPNSTETTVSLSPEFTWKNCYHDDYFTSPWSVLEMVSGAIASFSLMRNDILTYFWTEYHFHVTLTPFCSSIFTPLSSIWLPNFLNRIQHLTIELDLTRFGGNALKFARRFEYNMEKMESLLLNLVSGLIQRRGRMAEFTLLCRRFNGYRPVDEDDPDWKADDLFEYFPKEAMQFCDAIINLRGTIRSVRIAGFPLDYTRTLLKAIFGHEENSRQFFVPDRSAWPPLPQRYSGIKQTPDLYSASIAPMSPQFPDYQESLHSPWLYEASVYSLERPGNNDDLPVRPDTSLSVTTVGEHVKLYQELSPPIPSTDSSLSSGKHLLDSTEKSALTYQVMEAEDRNNSKQHTKKLNPRNSRDFSPGHFYRQIKEDPEPDLNSQEERTSNTAVINLVQQASDNACDSQITNQREFPPSGEESHRSIYNEREKTLPKAHNFSSKRRSQFSERQMPDIPEGPVNTTPIGPHTPTAEIRSGTLKASSDLHLKRIRAHIEKSTLGSDEGYSKPPSPPSHVKITKAETLTESDDNCLVQNSAGKSRSEALNDCTNFSSPQPSPQTANDNIQESVLETPIDRSLLRTPSPPARPATVTSPNALNSMNEKDPKYLLSIRALRSASTSTESVIRSPAKVHRPVSLVQPTTWSGIPMISAGAPQRSFTSTGPQPQRRESAESDSRKLRFLGWMRRSG